MKNDIPLYIIMFQLTAIGLWVADIGKSLRVLRETQLEPLEVSEPFLQHRSDTLSLAPSTFSLRNE